MLVICILFFARSWCSIECVRDNRQSNEPNLRSPPWMNAMLRDTILRCVCLLRSTAFMHECTQYEFCDTMSCLLFLCLSCHIMLSRNQSIQSITKRRRWWFIRCGWWRNASRDYILFKLLCFLYIFLASFRLCLYKSKKERFGMARHGMVWNDVVW